MENDSLCNLGLKPTFLAQGLMEEISEVAGKYAHRSNPDLIPCRSYWRTAKNQESSLGEGIGTDTEDSAEAPHLRQVLGGAQNLIGPTSS